MATIEKPIDKWPVTDAPITRYHSRVKVLYFEAKKLKSFFKGMGRFVDISPGSPTLWFEVSGNSLNEVVQRARNFSANKAGTARNLTIKPSQWHSGGKVVNMNPGPRGATFMPMAASHPDYGKFQQTAAPPRGMIKDLVDFSGGERVDAIGKITEIKRNSDKVVKVDVWIKGEDEQEVLVEMWGATFQQLLANAVRGTTILQVDNARVMAKENGTRHLSAEAFKDSALASSWAFLDPPHSRTVACQASSNAHGNRISSIWAPSNSSKALVRMCASNGLKFKTCMGTLRTCSLAWQDADPATTADALPESIEVAAQGVWLTEVSNQTPVYTECRLCHTKIDPGTGLCKKADDNHIPEASEEKVALSSVRLADSAGSYHDILARTDELCKLAGVADVDELERRVLAQGVQSLAFRGQFDVVLGANQVKHGPPQRLAKGGPDGPECKFEVLRVDAVMLEKWDTSSRPALGKILNCKSDPNTGHVLPLKCPVSDLVPTAAGVKFAHGTCFPQYVSILGWTKEAPSEQTMGEGDEAISEIVHAAVFPAECAADAEDAGIRDAKPFAVEVLCSLAEKNTCSMPGGKPYLIVGTPSCDAGAVTLQATAILDVTTVDDAISKFTAEREGWWDLLTKKIEQNARKRSAKELIMETPTKKKCS